MGPISSTGEPNLAGARILIVEDDYLLAFDAEYALRKNNAEVVGPFSTEAEAIEAIQQGGLTAAVTDINLGSGPSFTIARALRQAKVPFALLTGYDRSAVPAEFADVLCLVKPIDTKQMVKALACLLANQ